MIIPYVAIWATIFGYLIIDNNPIAIIQMSLGMMVVFYIHQSIKIKSYNFLRRIFIGDCLYQLAYMAWLYYFEIHYFMHFIPLMLSNVGKNAIMADKKNGEVMMVVQELIIFQNQCEAYILFTLFVEILTFNKIKLLQFIFFAAIVKMKYRFYRPSHKAYNEMHFFLDRLSRRLNIRWAYHSIYWCVTLFSNDVYTPTSYC